MTKKLSIFNAYEIFAYEKVFKIRTKDNILYNIIVTNKKDEQGVLKLLKNNAPTIPEADKFILLFEDETCFDNIICSTPFAYCIYPSLKIIQKKKKC